MDTEAQKQFAEQFGDLAQQVLNIKINEKITVMFNVNDDIFKLSNKIS